METKTKESEATEGKESSRRKISPREMMGMPGNEFNFRQRESGKKTGDIVRLYVVYGQALGWKVGDGDFGNWISFIGNFEAESLVTGEIVRSFRMFLPRLYAEMLQKTVGPEGSENPVEIALEVSMELTKDRVGFQYNVDSILDARQTLSTVREKIKNARPKLLKSGKDGK